MKKTIISLLALFLTMPVYAKKLHYESEYQNAWCSANNGTVEYQLPDLARVDCIMPKYAVEFDTIGILSNPTKEVVSLMTHRL